MPEGDTVWQTAVRLRRLDGGTLADADLRVPSLATVELRGVSVLTTVTRGKHLLTRFDNDLTLHSHLRMEGTWDVHDVGRRWRRPAHTARVVLRTEVVEAVGFDVILDLVATADEHELVGHLGPDLLDPGWDEAHAAEAVARLAAEPDAELAPALLDQRHLAGIGNVYACELCFLTGHDPRTRVGDLADLDRIVGLGRRLLVANRDRPIRITTGDRRPGRQTWVYRRRGPCLRCSTPIVADEVGPPGLERTTWWCPSCQR